MKYAPTPHVLLSFGPIQGLLFSKKTATICIVTVVLCYWKVVVVVVAVVKGRTGLFGSLILSTVNHIMYTFNTGFSVQHRKLLSSKVVCR